MLDYIFFQETSRQQFIEYLDQQGISHESSEDQHMGHLVHVPMLEADPKTDAIEQLYEQLNEADEALFMDEQDGNQITALSVTLQDGRVSYAPIEPDMMNRLMSVLTPEEIGELVSAIAKAVEEPELRRLCQID